MSDVAQMGARQRDQSFSAAFAQPLLVDFSTAAILVVAKASRKPIAQLQITGAGRTQEQAPVRFVAIALIGDPDIATDQRLQPLAARGLIELHHTEYIRQ